VSLQLDGGLVLEVADDGVGLVDGARMGIGLRSMRERAAELGGSFAVTREAGGGACIRVRLPVAR
jgi:signal transduction histidine kinase